MLRIAQILTLLLTAQTHPAQAQEHCQMLFPPAAAKLWSAASDVTGKEGEKRKLNLIRDRFIDNWNQIPAADRKTALAAIQKNSDAKTVFSKLGALAIREDLSSKGVSSYTRAVAKEGSIQPGGERTPTQFEFEDGHKTTNKNDSYRVSTFEISGRDPYRGEAFIQGAGASKARFLIAAEMNLEITDFDHKNRNSPEARKKNAALLNVRCKDGKEPERIDYRAELRHEIPLSASQPIAQKQALDKYCVRVDVGCPGVSFDDLRCETDAKKFIATYLMPADCKGMFAAQAEHEGAADEKRSADAERAKRSGKQVIDKKQGR